MALDVSARVAERHLQMADLEERFGVYRTTIDRWLENGLFPKPIQVSRRRFWRLADIEAFEAASIGTHRQAQGEGE